MSDASHTLNGATVLDARVYVPRVGLWHAALVVDSDVDIAGAVVLGLYDGALSLSGTTVRGGLVDGRLEVRVVGGAGGMADVVPAKQFRGVPLRIALDDALTAAGEKRSGDSDATVLGTWLENWCRVESSASMAVAMLLAEVDGAAWRPRADGSIWVGTETWPTSTAVGDLLVKLPLLRAASVSFSAPTLLVGETYLGRHVGAVEHVLTAGESRATVWFEP